MTTRSNRGAVQGDPIKEATVAALHRILEPLVELMLDAGVTVHEFNKLARERAVRVAIKRMNEEGNRKSISRAAIMTGLPRSEVANILKSLDTTSTLKRDQLPARRILAAWHDTPRFAAANGEPAILPIFGRSLSFEQLVKKHGGGIPVRAMLDELTQIQAVERLPDQRVKVKVRVPILTGLTTRSIAAVGERSHDLLQTLAHNRRSCQPLFEATAVIDNGDPEMISFVRREITEQGARFIEKIGSLLTQSQSTKNHNGAPNGSSCRLGVTAYLFHDDPSCLQQNSRQLGNRKNLRRQVKRTAKS